MKVKELIEKLKEFDPEEKIYGMDDDLHFVEYSLPPCHMEDVYEVESGRFSEGKFLDDDEKAGLEPQKIFCL